MAVCDHFVHLCRFGSTVPLKSVLNGIDCVAYHCSYTDAISSKYLYFSVFNVMDNIEKSLEIRKQCLRYRIIPYET